MSFKWSDVELRRLSVLLRRARTKEESTALARQVRPGVELSAVKTVVSRYPSYFGAPTLDQLLLANATNPVTPTHDTEPGMRAVRPEEEPIPGPRDSDAVIDIPIDVELPDAEVKPLRDLVREREAQEESAREKAAVEDLVRQLREANKRVAFLDAMREAHEPPHVIAREHHGLREMAAIALASDWHVEQRVEPQKIAYRNEYDLDIAAHRIDRFFNAIVWQVEHHRASGRVSIRDLVLWLGGDFMTGYIHPELVETTAFSPTGTMRWLMPRLLGGIRYLLEALALERIVIPCSPGNHGRTTQKTQISTTAENSFEWLMYTVLADQLQAEPRVTFEITMSRHQYVRVYDQILHFHHGDDVRYMGGVGGLGIPLLKRVPQWNMVKRADVHHIGHWHQLRDYGECVVNGSLIGYDEYAQSIGASFEEPKQAFYFLDSKRGKTMLAPLWVADSAPLAAA